MVGSDLSTIGFNFEMVFMRVGGALRDARAEIAFIIMQGCKVLCALTLRREPEETPSNAN